MKVLFVVPYVPSLVRVRPYNLIRHLAARGHQVTLATVWTNDQERRELEDLGKHCAGIRAVYLSARQSLVNCVIALPKGAPLQAHYSWSADLEKQLADLVPDVDVVHVEHLRGALYGLAAKRAALNSGTPVVWDSVDCISSLFEHASYLRPDHVGRLITRLELSRTRRFESHLLRQFDRVVVSSALDRQFLLNLSNGRRQEERTSGKGTPSRNQPFHPEITALPNGVDLDYFTPPDAAREADTLVFSGKMSYHANESAAVHLVRHVMPRVWAKQPKTHLVIAGKDPSRRLRRLIAGHSSQITVTGTVADLRPFLRRAAVAAVPLVYGAGCQNKVLEAMSCATPVVATPQAVAALKAEAGRDVLVAADAETFAQALLLLLESPHRRHALGHAGRRYVEANHRWDGVAARLEKIYQQVIVERGARGMAYCAGAGAAL